MSRLWAITCYFNPAGYRRRLENYRWFRQRLAVPLVAVELSFNGEYELRPEDADVLVQLDQGDILFQKERLLNVSLSHLPVECKAVAWIDCDVLFGTPTWHVATLAALEHSAIVQPYSERFDLPPDSSPDDITAWNRPCDRLSLMAKIARDGIRPMHFQDLEAPPVGKPSWGLAWAARRDVLDQHGFYDACVLTGGDLAIFCAAIGAMEGRFLRSRMNDLSHRHYMAWAKPFYETVRGSVSHIEGGVFHLWHGSLAERRYGPVLRELRDMGFDPFTDIELTEQETWRWASDKPVLHTHVREYFWSRNEDGERPVAADITRATQ